MKLLNYIIDFLLKDITKLLINFYKLFISPLLGNNCRFYPSCSTYMLEAIDKKGIIIGIIMGACRILRCNPWSKFGHDPVVKLKRKKF